MDKRMFLGLALSCVLGMSLPSLTCDAKTPEKKKEKTEAADTVAKKNKYEELLKGKRQTATGMITLHEVGGKLYFELPLNLLGKDMLIGSTVTQVSDNGNAIVGSKPAAPLHVTFTKSDTHVQLRQVNTDYVTTDAAIDKALEKSSLGSIMVNQKIHSYNTDSSAVVFEMTDFFVGDNKKMSPFDRNSLYASSYERSETFRRDASYLSGIKAFPDNVSIKSVLSYTYSLKSRRGIGTALKDAPFTAEMTRSIILLPEKPYKPRIADYRIGIFPTKRDRLGEGSNTTAEVFFANRWRLEPSDTAAYRRGEKVAPVKPIVFYVDSDFPESWKPAIREAINQWSELFEKIGFKDAVVARDFPTDDPEFDPDNLKYSCVRYAPISIQNAMGPSWVDPRSGEILNASVYLYHDVIKLLYRWRFVQTAPADESVRAAALPDDVFQDGFRYIISHEVGHCLGFMHNMAASSSIPVDSLRSPTFTQKNGTTYSIMDYARFNYVAQPGDKERGVKLTPPRFGLYDQYLVAWNYTPVFFDDPSLTEAEEVRKESEITGKWISDALKAYPWARYGKQQFSSSFYDPTSQSEDLGDNTVKATRYGVANLKYVMAHFDEWLAGEDEDFEIRADILQGIINQLLTYVQHVYFNVGGIYKNEVKEGDPLPAFAAIPRERQVEALEYLFELFGDMDWLDNRALLDKMAIAGSPKAALENKIGNLIISAPFNVSMTSKVAGGTFSFRDCSDIVFDFIWKPVSKGNKVSPAEMRLQNSYVSSMMRNGNFKVPGSSGSLTGLEAVDNGEISGFDYGVRAIFNKGEATVGDVYAYLTRAMEMARKGAKRTKGETKAHYELIVKTLEASLK